MGNKAATTGLYFDVIMDLDGTIVYLDFDIAKPDLLVRNPQIDKMIPYCLAHGAIPFLSSLMTLPDCRVSFYSAGEKWRNDAIVDEIMRLVHACLRLNGVEISSLAFWRQRVKILSREDVAVHGGKDLLKVHKTLSLDRSILIDDTMTAVEGQTSNIILVSPGLGIKDPNRSRMEASLINNNLVYALGKVLFCYDQWKHKNIPVPESIRHLKICEEAEHDNSREKHSHNCRREYYQLGLEAIRRFAPSFDILLSDEDYFDQLCDGSLPNTSNENSP